MSILTCVLWVPSELFEKMEIEGFELHEKENIYHVVAFF